MSATVVKIKVQRTRTKGSRGTTAMMKSVRKIAITSSPRTRRAIHQGLRPRPPDRGFGVQTTSATGSPGAAYFGAKTGKRTDLACTCSMRREHARATHRAPTGTESPAIVICANQLSLHSHTATASLSHLISGMGRANTINLLFHPTAPPLVSVCRTCIRPANTSRTDLWRLIQWSCRPFADRS
jgi:hypothetical protein